MESACTDLANINIDIACCDKTMGSGLLVVVPEYPLHQLFLEPEDNLQS